MTFVPRLLLTLACLLAWRLWLVPTVTETLTSQRTHGSPPPRPEIVLAQLGRLPRPLRDAPEARALEHHARVALELRKGDTRWMRVVASVLSAEERAAALALAGDTKARTEPSREDEAEARRLARLLAMPPHLPRGADRELWRLATLLLERVGLDPAVAVPATATDPWPGVDRRTRAIALFRLISTAGIDPPRGHLLLNVTLAQLKQDVAYTAELEALAAAYPGVMGVDAAAAR